MAIITATTGARLSDASCRAVTAGDMHSIVERIAELETALERSLALSHRQVDNMADVLRRCKKKLELCFEHHGAVYIGGTEHGHLMKLIDAALPPSEQR